MERDSLFEFYGYMTTFIVGIIIQISLSGEYINGARSDRLNRTLIGKH